MEDGKNFVSPCNGCPTPGECVTTEGCATAGMMVPTYYVAHPDGTYSAANPQPRFVGDHRPLDLLVEAGYVGSEVADMAVKIVRDADLGPNAELRGRPAGPVPLE